MYTRWNKGSIKAKLAPKDVSFPLLDSCCDDIELSLMYTLRCPRLYRT